MTMLLAIAGILIALDAIALLMAVGALRQGSGGMSLSTIAYGGAALIGSIVLLVLGNLSESSLLAVLAIGTACLPLLIVILPGLTRGSGRA
jgi:hypothetical protein